MANTTAGRRSARQRAPASTTENDNDAANNNNNNDSPIQSTDEQLERAMATVLKTRDRTIDVHRSWRRYLQRTSILVIFLALHQLRSTVNGLMAVKEERKASDGDEDGGEEPTWFWIWNNSLCELTGVAVTGFLSRFLNVWTPNYNDPTSTRNNFTLDTNFMIAAGLIPAQWILYHFYKGQHYNQQVPRSFPVSVIFFLIVAAAQGFMKHTMKQCDEHVDMVKRMKHQVAEARNANQRMKKTVAKAAAAKQQRQQQLQQQQQQQQVEPKSE